MSTLDGEPSQELHEHYDADGNPAGWTVVTRPGWSPEDRAWALGLALREATQCPHGHDLAEQLADDADQWIYVPTKPITCHACVASAAGVKKFEKHPDRHALLFGVERRPKPTRKRKR